MRIGAGHKLAFYSVGYSVLSRAGLFLINLLAAYFLTQADYGIYSFVAITALTVATLSGGGLGQAANLTAARLYEGEPERVSAYVSLALIIAVVATLLLTPLLAYPFLSAGAVDYPLSWTLLVGGAALLLIWHRIVEGTLFGLQQQKRLFVTAAMVLLLSVGAAAYASWQFGLIGAAAALFLYRLLLLLASWRDQRRLSSIAFSRSELNAHRSASWSIVRKTAFPISIASGMAMPVYTVLFGLLLAASGAEALAPLSFAYQFFVVLTFIPNALSNFLISAANQRGSASGVVFRRLFPLFLGSGVVGLAIMLAVPWASGWLTRGIVVPMPLAAYLGGGVLAYSVAIFLNSYWVSADRAFMAVVTQAISTATLLGAGFFLLKDMGGEGVALAIMLAMVAHLLVSLVAFPILSRTKADEAA